MNDLFDYGTLFAYRTDFTRGKAKIFSVELFTSRDEDAQSIGRIEAYSEERLINLVNRMEKCVDLEDAS